MSRWILGSCLAWSLGLGSVGADTGFDHGKGTFTINWKKSGADTFSISGSLLDTNGLGGNLKLATASLEINGTNVSSAKHQFQLKRTGAFTYKATGVGPDLRDALVLSNVTLNCTNEVEVALTIANAGSAERVAVADVVIIIKSAAGKSATGKICPACVPVTCEFALVPALQTYPSSASTGTVSVVTTNCCPGTNCCAWIAAASNTWISILTDPPIGRGSGTVSYALQPNPDGLTRTGMVAVFDATQLVIQDPVTCAYEINPSGDAFGAPGGTGQVTVNAPNGCAWQAAVTNDWLSLTSSNAGSGNGLVTYSVAPNASSLTRTGTVTVAGQPFTVTQTGVACTYALAPANTNVTASAGRGSVGVTTPAGCTWSATANDAWLHTSSSGTGSGTLSCSFDANPAGTARSGTINVQGQVFTVTQAAAACTYTLTAASTNVAASAGSGSVGVATLAGCAWTATSTTNWLHTSSSGTGSGTLSYTFDANPSGTPRSGMITVQGQTFTVSQAAAPCIYALWATSTNVAASAGTGSDGVTTLAGCAWTATSTTNWLHTSSSGTGSGTLSYTFDANPVSSSRSGTITVQGQAFTVNQAAAACNYGLTAASTNVAASAGTGSVGVATLAGCPWTATSNTNWIRTSSSGNGTGTVSYTFDQNPAGTLRDGTITVQGQAFTLTQAAAICTYTLLAAGTNVSASAGSGSVGVATLAGCPWTATSITNWLHTSSSGTGSGTLSYTFDANPAITSRSGTITVQGQTFTISQAAAPCTYALSATSTNVAAGAGSGSVGVTTLAGCAWTATSTTNWLHTSGSGTGSGTLSYTFDANPTGSSRSGMITVQDQTFRVNQAAAEPPPVITLSILPTNAVLGVTAGGVMSNRFSCLIVTNTSTAVTTNDVTLDATFTSLDTSIIQVMGGTFDGVYKPVRAVSLANVGTATLQAVFGNVTSTVPVRVMELTAVSYAPALPATLYKGQHTNTTFYGTFTDTVAGVSVVLNISPCSVNVRTLHCTTERKLDYDVANCYALVTGDSSAVDSFSIDFGDLLSDSSALNVCRYTAATVNTNNVTLGVNQTFQLQVSGVLYDGSTEDITSGPVENGGITYASDSASVNVSTTGLITAGPPAGQAQITITVNNTPCQYILTVDVTVTAP